MYGVIGRRSVKKQFEGIKTNNEGFTLLEVLVAMIILTVVCVPLLRSFATSAQTNAKAKIQSRCTTASENVMEKIRNMPTEDIFTTFSGITGSGEDIHFEIDDDTVINADLPDDYRVLVDLNANVDPNGDMAYPNANSLNMADFSPISVRDCAIYTMPSGYDKEAYDWYATKSAEAGTNKDWKYFRGELTRDIVFKIEDTGIPYTDDEGNTKNAVKVSMQIQYYCNAGSIVDPANRTHVTSAIYLFDNTATHNDLSGIYLFYYPRYTAATGGGAIRKDIVEVENPTNVKTDLYLVAMNNAANENNTLRDTYLTLGKGLKVFITENNLGSEGKAGISLKTNLLKTSATTTLRTPYSTNDTASDYGLGLDISFKAGSRRAYANPADEAALLDELTISDVDGKRLKSETNVRIYKVTVRVINTATGEEVSKMEGTKLRHEQ